MPRFAIIAYYVVRITTKKCDINNLQAVFQVTEVSRNIIFFPRLFHEVIIGERSIEDSIKILDKTYCECPELMENMMTKWKLYNDEVKDWKSYLDIIRYPEDGKSKILDTSIGCNWFTKLSNEALQLDGYHDKRPRY